ncbi:MULTISPECIES: alpha/beta fold hydrolase [unclassified Nocardia]|uniref:alpha/beta fold hydrolase n=1 Tax=unclassified Nocardia TaxID=2637762 RepID=UPI001CE3D50E|nr:MULTISPECIES: alpha/beta hydrolase [unclassified Nocardia]
MPGSAQAVTTGEMNVRSDGPADAATVLLIHGFAASLHWFDRVTELLVPAYRVLRVDLRGHGRTGGRFGFDPESQSRAIVSVLDALDIRDAVVLGHSFGADVALAVGRRSERVSAVGIIGQAPDFSYSKLPAAGVLLTLPVLGTLVHRITPAAAIRFGMRTAFARGFRARDVFDRPDRPVLDYRAMHPGMFREVLVDRPARLRGEPLDAQLRAIGKPALVIHGSDDQLYDTARTVARYAAAGARVEVVDGAGHSPNIERPNEFARLVGEFRTETGLRAG